MAPRLHTVLASPLGPLTLVAADGLLCGLYMEGQRHRPAQQTFGAPAPAGAAPFREAAEQLAAYFAGELREFDLPPALEGTAFQRTVWRELCRVPYGSTVTYGQLAERIRSPGSARAVGLANGRNPVGIVVPCHRVVGASGSLTGYGGGLERKRRLLGLEGAGAAGRWSGALW